MSLSGSRILALCQSSETNPAGLIKHIKETAPEFNLLEALQFAQKVAEVGLEALIDKNPSPLEVAALIPKLGPDAVSYIKKLQVEFGNIETVKLFTLLRELRKKIPLDLLKPAVSQKEEKDLFANQAQTLRKAAGEGKDIPLDEKDRDYQNFKQLVGKSRLVIDKPGAKGMSALYFAIKNKQFNKAIVLIKVGNANIRAKYKADVETPLELAETMLPELPKELAMILFFQEFINAAKSGNLERVKKFVNSGKIDVNAVDPVSGRGALHEIYLALNEKNSAVAVYLLKEVGANRHLEDKEGFTPEQLFVNPHPFNSDNVEPLGELNQRMKYREFIVSTVNSELKQHNAIMIMIKNTREIPGHVRANPTRNICFLIDMPKSVKPIKSEVLDIHVTPIYFFRKEKMQIFVQFDSLSCVCLVIPAAKLDASCKEQRIYFSPFRRQYGMEGCFEDAVVLLMKMAMTENLLELCHKNSVVDKIHEKVAPSEQKYLRQNQHAFNRQEMPYSEMLAFLGVAQKTLFQKQINGELGPYSEEPITNIFRFTSPPEFALLNIGKFDAMRYMRVNFPQLFTTRILDQIFKIEEFGVKRFQIKDSEIREHISDPDKKYDFCVSFEKRKKVWSKYYDEFQNIHQIAQGFFATRLSSHRDVVPQLSDRVESIATLVTEYASTKPDFRM